MKNLMIPCLLAFASLSATAADAKTGHAVVIEKYEAGKKVGLVKIIRENTTLGLKEAKEVLDKLPGVIGGLATKAEAEALAKKLTEGGATVRVK